MTSGVKRSNKQIDKLKEKIVEYLVDKLGTTFMCACRKKKVGPSEAYTWRKEDPEWNTLVEAALEIRTEMLLDHSESKMFERIDGVYTTRKDGKTVYKVLPDTTMIMYHTSNKGKHRGYGKTTIETDPNHPLKLEVTVTNKIVYPTKRETKS